jgi:hypothetical protein
LKAGFGIDHALRQAVMIAQIDEEQIAMVAAAVNPAGDSDGLPTCSGAQLAAGMGTVAMHGSSLSFSENGCLSGPLVAVWSQPVKTAQHGL